MWKWIFHHQKKVLATFVLIASVGFVITLRAPIPAPSSSQLVDEKLATLGSTQHDATEFPPLASTTPPFIASTTIGTIVVSLEQSTSTETTSAASIIVPTSMVTRPPVPLAVVTPPVERLASVTPPSFSPLSFFLLPSSTPSPVPLAPAVAPSPIVSASALPPEMVIAPAPSSLVAAASPARVTQAALPKGCTLSALLTRTGTGYVTQVGNIGDAMCKNVSYTVYYASEEKFVSATPSPTASNYYWHVGNLKSGQTRSATITMEGKGSGGELCAASDNGTDACVNVTGGAPTPDVVVTPPPPPTPPPVVIPPTLPPPPVVSVSDKEYGVWVWDSPYQMTLEKRKSVVAEAKKSNFNAIYITIDDYLTTAVSAQSAYALALDSFLTIADASGIKVDVVGGARSWAKPDNRAKGYALITFVDTFNRSHTTHIRGLQYDVEPYLLPEYEGNKASVLLDFVAFIDESVTRMSGVDAAFTVVVPHFYDAKQLWTPPVTFGGRTAHTFTHVLTSMNRLPKGTITIMAYRNVADGADGVIALASAEIAEATQVGGSTKVVVAQEVGDVAPSYVTYFGLSRADLYGQVAKVNDAFQASLGFGGIAVHYLDPFLLLR